MSSRSRAHAQVARRGEHFLGSPWDWNPDRVSGAPTVRPRAWRKGRERRRGIDAMVRMLWPEWTVERPRAAMRRIRAASTLVTGPQAWPDRIYVMKPTLEDLRGRSCDVIVEEEAVGWRSPVTVENPPVALTAEMLDAAAKRNEEQPIGGWPVEEITMEEARRRYGR